jgi:16S rRNA (cytidine1402-2'-O)-methyltransferase
VATPIGTLADLSPRAREVLAEVDLVLAEDTRRARALLSHLGVRARRLQSLHEHNEARRLPGVLSHLEDGGSAAVISEAGTPVLCDPGFELVREARRRGVEVRSLPGPSVFAAALAASGQPPMPAVVVGFLPPRRGPRRRRLGELAGLGAAGLRWSLVILLSPHRLSRELADLAEVLGGDRPATLLAEISKRHERALVATLDELAASSEAGQPRGEYVIVVGPAAADAARPCAGAGSDQPPAQGLEGSQVDEVHRIRTAYTEELGCGATPREALRAVAARLGRRRSEVYKIVHVDEKTPR